MQSESPYSGCSGKESFELRVRDVSLAQDAEGLVWVVVGFETPPAVTVSVPHPGGRYLQILVRKPDGTLAHPVQAQRAGVPEPIAVDGYFEVEKLLYGTRFPSGPSPTPYVGVISGALDKVPEPGSYQFSMTFASSTGKGVSCRVLKGVDVLHAEVGMVEVSIGEAGKILSARFRGAGGGWVPSVESGLEEGNEALLHQWVVPQAEEG